MTTSLADLSQLASGYDTDKAVNAHYLRNYEGLFRDLRNKDVRLLELGIHTGGSLLLWRDYFPNSSIVGLDKKPVRIDDPTNRIRTYQGAQDDLALLDRIGRETAPGGFDVIIDDCSHIGVLTRASFWHLFDNHLKSGGIYAIEDWGTGYWGWWPDGVDYVPPSKRRRAVGHRIARMAGIFSRIHGGRVSKRFPFIRRPVARLKAIALDHQFHGHDFGMVGFVKELIDEAGAGDITHQKFGIGPYRASRFREMRISHGHAVVIKS